MTCKFSYISYAIKAPIWDISVFRVIFVLLHSMMLWLESFAALNMCLSQFASPRSYIKLWYMLIDSSVLSRLNRIFYLWQIPQVAFHRSIDHRLPVQCWGASTIKCTINASIPPRYFLCGQGGVVCHKRTEKTASHECLGTRSNDRIEKRSTMVAVTASREHSFMRVADAY